MRDHRAFGFTADLDEAEMRARWTSIAGVAWVERDNDEWGGYASAVVEAPSFRARLRLFHERSWCIDVEVVGARSAAEAFIARIRADVLPAIGARDIRDAEPYDLRSRLDDVDPVDALVTYLRARSPAGIEDALARAVAYVQGEFDARMLSAWWAGQDDAIADGLYGFDGARVRLGPLPPAHAEPGELWFDVCELVTMVRTSRSWFSLDLVGAFHLKAFLALAELVPLRSQLPETRTQFDPRRLGGFDPRRRVDSITQGEATLYAWWFGKSLPHRFDYQEAGEILPAEPSLSGFAATFRTTEWTSSRTPDDERARVTIRPCTLGIDPDDDDVTVLDAAEAPREVYFRTSVGLSAGLFTKLAARPPELVLAEPATLRTVLDRGGFRRG